MKILLVYPPRGSDFGFTNILQVEPLGLECVGAALLEAGHDVELIDMRMDGWEDLRSKFQRQGPDAVGVSFQFATNTYGVLHVGRMVREMSPRVMLFAGGHHATLQPRDLLFPGSPFNCVVHGEGEITARELLAASAAGRNPATVPGVMTLENIDGAFKPRPRARDLDSFPLPARSLSARYRRKYHQGSKVPSACVETSRGCPFDCNFCSIWVYYGRTYRRRSVEGITRDLDMVPESNIFFTDDIAFLHRQCYEDLGRALKNRTPRRLFTAETRCDLVVKHRDLFELWRSVGLDSVFLGVEKIDDEGLAAVRKRSDKEKTALAIRILRDLEIRPYTAFIVDPQWTENDFDRLEAYIDELELLQPTFTVLTPLPGTLLYERWKSRIVEQNYLLFDTCHAVVPTRLPLDRFYQRFARLYTRTARWERAGISALRTALRLTARGHGSVYRRLMKALKDLRDPAAYLRAPVESRPPGAPPLAPESRSAVDAGLAA